MRILFYRWTQNFSKSVKNLKHAVLLFLMKVGLKLVDYMKKLSFIDLPVKINAHETRTRLGYFQTDYRFK